MQVTKYKVSEQYSHIKLIDFEMNNEVYNVIITVETNNNKIHFVGIEDDIPVTLDEVESSLRDRIVDIVNEYQD